LINKDYRFSLHEVSNYEDWMKLYEKCTLKTLPQTWEYGTAKAKVEFWSIKRYKIINNLSQAIGIVQVLYINIPIIGKIVRINRGPLLTNDISNNDSTTTLSIINFLCHEAKKNKWIMLQIAPLINFSNNNYNNLLNSGFQNKDHCSADTSIINLLPNKDELLMSFDGKWRNQLKKGLKSNILVINTNSDNIYFEKMLSLYNTQQKINNFKGTSNKILKALFNNQTKNFRFNLFIAIVNNGTDDEIIGFLVTFQYTNFSEYIIGISTETGKKLQVNSVLLWEALIFSKNCNNHYFDLGGLSDDTPSGIANFKRGLNGEPLKLIGEWRKFFIFFNL
jgi:lipid II:glycine glycyltransferase (peptidoglycan interpeptide bridge formation enzyme)